MALLVRKNLITYFTYNEIITLNKKIVEKNCIIYMIYGKRNKILNFFKDRFIIGFYKYSKTVTQPCCRSSL